MDSKVNDYVATHYKLIHCNYSFDRHFNYLFESTNECIAMTFFPYSQPWPLKSLAGFIWSSQPRQYYLECIVQLSFSINWLLFPVVHVTQDI